MEFTQQEHAVRIQVPILNKEVTTEIATDLTLPDYQPPVKRLLRVRAVVSPPDRYISAGNAEFSGTVDYSVLYAGEDSAIYCANHTEEYRFGVPMEVASDIELGEGLLCDVPVCTESTSGRVTAPRKLALKCRLHATVHIFGVRCMEEQTSALPPEGTERLLSHVECAQIFAGSDEPLRLGDEILCEGTGDALRVICASAQVFVTEATAGSGTVHCRGEVCLKLLCAHEVEGDIPSPLFRRIPFSHEVPTDGVEVNCDCCAYGSCSDLQITVEDGKILCDVSILLKTKAQRNVSVSYTRDLYSTVAETETRYVGCTAPGALLCHNGNVSLNTTLSLEEAGIRPGQRVVDIDLQPTVTAMESERGKVQLSGNCRCFAILFDGEDYGIQEFDLPFRYAVDCPTAPTAYEAIVDVITCRSRADGERVGVDAELSVCLALRTETDFSLVAEAVMGETIHTNSAVCTVCYPGKGDTLWSVAKRHHRAVSALSAANALSDAPRADSPESLAGVTYLLI